MLLLHQCSPKNKRKFPPFLSPRSYLILFLHLSHAQITKDRRNITLKEKKKRIFLLCRVSPPPCPLLFFFLPSFLAMKHQESRNKNMDIITISTLHLLEVWHLKQKHYATLHLRWFPISILDCW